MLSKKVPALVTGLFTSRFLAELLAQAGWPLSNSWSGQLLTALGLTALALYGSYQISRRWPALPLWPLLWLGLYVLAPNSAPRWLILSILLTLITFLLQSARTGRLDETRRGSGLTLAGLIALFLAAYALTLAPDLLPADNGEFQLRAAQFGVAHPPGFPLYTLLAGLFSRLPLGVSQAWRVNLFGLLCALATLAVIYLITYRLFRSSLAALTGTAFLGVATTFWAQATTANIRSLTALFAALLLAVALEWYAAQQAQRLASHWPPLFAFLLVLGVGHHASLIFMGVILTLFMIWSAPHYWWQPRIWPGLGGAALLGLLPQSYLWLRGAAGAPGAPDDLATLPGLFNHILARGFQGDLFHFLSWPDFADRLRVMVDVHLFQWPASLLLAAFAGWLLLLRQRRPIAVLLLALSLTHTLITATYRAPQTVEYMLPAYLPWAIALAALPGLWPAQRRFQPRTSWQNQLWPALMAVLLVLIGWQFSRLYPQYRQVRLDNDTRAYIQRLLDDAPTTALILADWHWATPLWYATEVEGQRPDVTVHYVFPTAEPYGETWARRVREAGDRPVITTHYDPGPFASLPPAQPLGEAFLFNADFSLPVVQPADVLQFGNNLRLIPSELPGTPAAAGETFAILLTARLEGSAPPPVLFAHLVAANGRLVAQQDIPIPATIAWQDIRLTLTPQLQALPGHYQLMLGAYEAGSSTPLLAPNGDTRIPVGELELVARNQPPVTQNQTYRPDPDNDRSLIGYDWDTTWANEPRLYLHWQVPGGFVTETPPLSDGVYHLPPWRGPWGFRYQRTLSPDGAVYVPFPDGIVWLGPLWPDGLVARAGASLHLWGHWGGNRPVYRDYAVAIRLVGYETGGRQWAWADLDDRFGVPAMGAIPTLKWVGGSQVYDSHRLTVSPEATPAQQLGVILGLYNTMTNEPLLPLDERYNAASPLVEVTLGRGKNE